MRCLIALLLVATPTCAELYRAPRTAWRAPSLEGVWDGNTATPLQRAAKHFKARIATAEEVTAYEGNYALRNILAGGRANAPEAAAK